MLNGTGLPAGSNALLELSGKKEIGYLLLTTKGQLISEWLFGVLNIRKTNPKTSAQESKKWLNQKDKGTLLC